MEFIASKSYFKKSNHHWFFIRTLSERIHRKSILFRKTGKILLDAEMQEPVVEEIKQVIEQFDSMIKLMDLHVWQVGKGKFACILSLQTSNQFLTPQAIKQALSIHEEIVHASIEINLIH